MIAVAVLGIGSAHHQRLFRFLQRLHPSPRVGTSIGVGMAVFKTAHEQPLQLRR